MQLDASHAPVRTQLADRALIGIGLMTIGTTISLLVFASRGFAPSERARRSDESPRAEKNESSALTAPTRTPLVRHRR